MACVAHADELARLWEVGEAQQCVMERVLGLVEGDDAVGLKVGYPKCYQIPYVAIISRMHEMYGGMVP